MKWSGKVKNISISILTPRGGWDRGSGGHWSAKGSGWHLWIGGRVDIPRLRTQSWCCLASLLQVQPWKRLVSYLKIYYARMMREEIDQFSSHVPKSPIRYWSWVEWSVAHLIFFQGIAWIGARDCQIWKAREAGRWKEGKGQRWGFWQGRFQGGQEFFWSQFSQSSSLQGIGRNYRIAKCTAAKCALKALRKQKEKEVRRKK